MIKEQSPQRAMLRWCTRSPPTRTPHGCRRRSANTPGWETHAAQTRPGKDACKCAGGKTRALTSVGGRKSPRFSTAFRQQHARMAHTVADMSTFRLQISDTNSPRAHRPRRALAVSPLGPGNVMPRTTGSGLPRGLRHVVALRASPAQPGDSPDAIVPL